MNLHPHRQGDDASQRQMYYHSAVAKREKWNLHRTGGLVAIPAIEPQPNSILDKHDIVLVRPPSATIKPIPIQQNDPSNEGCGSSESTIDGRTYHTRSAQAADGRNRWRWRWRSSRIDIWDGALVKRTKWRENLMARPAYAPARHRRTSGRKRKRPDGQVHGQRNEHINSTWAWSSFSSLKTASTAMWWMRFSVCLHCMNEFWEEFWSFL